MENHKELGKILKLFYIKYTNDINNYKRDNISKSSKARAIKILKRINDLSNTLHIALLDEEFNGTNKKMLDTIYSSDIRLAFKRFLSEKKINKDIFIDITQKISYMQLYNEFGRYLSNNNIISISVEDFRILMLTRT